VEQCRTSATGVVFSGSLGRATPTRSARADGSIEPHDRGVNHRGKERGRENARAPVPSTIWAPEMMKSYRACCAELSPAISRSAARIHEKRRKPFLGICWLRENADVAMRHCARPLLFVSELSHWSERKLLAQRSITLESLHANSTWLQQLTN